MPYKKRKKPLRGIGLLVGAMCPIRSIVVWALDFQFDQTADGRSIKLLNTIDEFTRECLAIAVEPSIYADAVVATLEKLTVDRRAPDYLWASTTARVHRPRRGRLVPVQQRRHVVHRPGLTMAERLDRVVQRSTQRRAPHGQLFDSLLEAQVLTELWRIDYNNNRRHSGIGRHTPATFAEAWNIRNQLQLA